MEEQDSANLSSVFITVDFRKKVRVGATGLVLVMFCLSPLKASSVLKNQSSCRNSTFLL